MTKILMITTGGTIASKQTEYGLSPLITSEEILELIPGVSDFCEVETLPLFNLDSTNVSPNHWLQIVDCIKKNYESFDGFVVTHGTDTMAYSAAALSYLIQKSKKPIVLTGSQKSIFEENTDAKLNLMNSFIFASDSESHGVHIVFDGKAIIGTRARKLRTKSYNAFSSIDYPATAIIRDNKIIRYIKDIPFEETPVFYDTLKERVFLLKLIPGLKADIFEYLKENYDIIIMEGFGVGGIPVYETSSYLDSIKDWIHSGKMLVMTTQVTYEGSDMEVYEVGYQAKKDYNVLEAYNMTLEATVTKLMWILGQTDDLKKIKELFYTPICFDLFI
ncbi:MAG: asparaginase [bacterium]|nr:asparaginase [bacterium]